MSSRGGQPTTLSIFDRNADSAQFPLMLPNGDPGYRIGIPKRKAQATAGTGNRPQATGASATDQEPDDDAGANEDVVDDGTLPAHVSIAEYYRYHLAIRGTDPTGSEHFAIPCGQLFQEYLIYQSYKIDLQVHAFLRKKAAEGLLCTTSNAVREAIARRLQRTHPGCELGNVLRLPTTYIGSPQYYQHKFHDAMHMFSQVGRPTFMITSTANPNWKELKELRAAGQTLPDRPDLMNRVFFIKIKLMRQRIEATGEWKNRSKGGFGKVVAMLESLEYQKRGPPHTHKLISVEGSDHTAAYVDEHVSAEIPPEPLATDPPNVQEQKKKLRELVLQYQVHHHSEHCLDRNGRCRKYFPKDYSNRTVVHDDRAATYRRRSPEAGGEVAFVKNKRITNGDIVPYCPAYMLMWQGHHNIEYCYGVMACKYAVKYHLKGCSYSYVRQQQQGTTVIDYDEAVGLMKAVYRGPHEGHARIYHQKIVRMDHNIMALNVHLPGEAPLYYRRDQYQRAVAAVLDDEVRLTQFEQFMRQCRLEVQQSILDMRKLTFTELPRHWWWNQKKNEWMKRTKAIKALGRIYPVSPSNPELFALYQLVLHSHGPDGYESLRTANGHLCDTFTQAAAELGLIATSAVWERTLAEAALTHSPRRMRYLFAQILLSCFVVQSATGLWNQFIDFMYDGRNISRPAERESRKDIALALLGVLLKRHQRTLRFYNMPEPSAGVASRFGLLDDADEDDFFFFGGGVDGDDAADDPTYTGPPRCQAVAVPDLDRRDFVHQNDYIDLNAEQKAVVDMVFAALDANVIDSNVPRLVFMEGAGGVGKTHVYNVLVNLCVMYRVRVLVTATTGVAATLLPMGSTLHSAFRLPLENINALRGSTVKLGTTLARRILATEVLIIDEVTMLRKEYLSIIDNTCRDLLPSHHPAKTIPFGGKIVLLGGDWQQLLPIVPNENLLAQVNACVKSSPLYALFRRVELTQNMRVNPAHVAFLDLLRHVGRDSGPKAGRFQVPDAMRAYSLDELVDFVYESGANLTDPLRLQECLLLALKRAEVQLLNDQILGMLPGQSHEYLSADMSLVDDPLDVYAARFDIVTLNAVDVAEMPPHRLVLKVGAVVVLLRNIDVYRGLSNGTRMVVEHMGQYFVDCKIIAGPHRGKQCTLQNFRFQYENKRVDGSGVRMTRFQLPVAPAFAMTVNKAQGQTVGRLGLYLRDQVFSHGQLYVALSRVRTADSLRIYMEGERDPAKKLEIDNIVLRNLLGR